MHKKLLTVAVLMHSITMAAIQKQASVAVQQPSQLPVPTLPRYENNVFAEADFIYWLAKQEGNDFAATGSAITVPGTVDPNTGLTPAPLQGSGKMYSPGSQMTPGFKVGLGVNLAHGGWDVRAQYTYFYSDCKKTVTSADLNAGILPIFSYIPNNSILSHATFSSSLASAPIGVIAQAQGVWSLQFNNVNFELGKNVNLHSTFAFRPHFGLQTSWQTQVFKANYAVSSLDFTSALGANRAQFDQDFWGMGLRLGLDGVWKCCNHVGVYVNTAASALWGQFTARGRSYDTNISASYQDVLISDVTNALHTISPVFEIAGGLQLDWAFATDYLFILQLGWEEQVWFFQNQHSTAIADTSLVLQGLTVKTTWSF